MNRPEHIESTEQLELFLLKHKILVNQNTLEYTLEPDENTIVDIKALNFALRRLIRKGKLNLIHQYQKELRPFQETFPWSVINDYINYRLKEVN
jgi:hypothetical protein